MADPDTARRAEDLPGGPAGTDAPPAPGRARTEHSRGDRSSAPSVGNGEACRDFSVRELLRVARTTGASRYSAPSLFFLLFLIVPIWTELPPLAASAATALCLVFGIQFLLAGATRYFGVRVAVQWLLAQWVVSALLIPFVGDGVAYLVIFVLAAHAVALPWKVSRIAVPAVGAAVLAYAIPAGNTVVIVLDLSGIALSMALAAAIHRGILEDELAEAQRRNALLAVSAERERIGRDLHDILGHSLTTITVSAQLARRLLDADPQGARTQIEEIERIARQSLADVRATASGMQQVRAATEIASARSVLTAAGIEASTPVSLPVLPDAQAELLGYVIREGVTNVVRHAGATRCSIELDTTGVRVLDDGTGIAPGGTRTGLAGLRHRVEEAGGSLDVRPGRGGGTVLEARLAGAQGGPA